MGLITITEQIVDGEIRVDDMIKILKPYIWRWAMVEVDNEDYDYCYKINVVYEREETKEEYDNRINENLEREKELKRLELIQYEKLKNKYGK